MKAFCGGFALQIVLIKPKQIVFSVHYVQVLGR